VDRLLIDMLEMAIIVVTFVGFALALLTFFYPDFWPDFQQYLFSKLPGNRKHSTPKEEVATLKFGNVATDWFPLEGTGDLPIHPWHLRTLLVAECVALPNDLDALRIETGKEIELKRKLGTSPLWNGGQFSLVSFYPTRYGQTEEPGITFEFQLTDYAAYIGLTFRADEFGLVNDENGNPTTIRAKYFPRFYPERPNPYLTHSFGVNLAVIAEDNKLMLTQRSDLVGSWKNMYHNSMNENMQYPQDMDEFGRPSFIKTAIRGLWEELGIELGALGLGSQVIEFLNFGALYEC
jgi:hypothetical protein